MKNLILTTTICLIGLSTLAQTNLYENPRIIEIVKGQDKILSSLNKRNLRYISSQEFPLKRNLQFNQPFLSILVFQDSIDFFKKGYIDGGIYYMDTSPFWGGFVTGIFSLGGWPIIVTIAISRTPPIDLRNPSNPSNDLLLSNHQYFYGFQSGAHKIKKRKTWTGFVAGIGTWAVVLLVSIPFILLFGG